MRPEIATREDDMDTLKWPLFFGFLCLNVIQSEASSWTATIPSSVKGLPGSCVVIPCSFNYPAPQTPVSEFTGYWMNDNNHLIYHPHESTIQEQYRNRTKLLGDVRHKNCSLMIDPLRESDQGPFHFRIEIKNYDKFSYRNNKVSISMMNELKPIEFTETGEVKEGQTVSVSCSVYHSCPPFPPVFNWNRTGQQHFSSQQLNGGQWKATSTLTFQPTHADHNRPLLCSVTYRGGRNQKDSTTLKVKHAPVNVNVDYKSDVKEGETVQMKCSSDAHPPANSYTWHNGTGAELHKGNVYTVHNVSRHTGGHLSCTAINEEGQGQSSPVKLNVLYAPEIKTASSCSLEGSVGKCVCIAESNPPSMVHFVLAGKVLQSTNVEKHGSLTIGTLHEELGSSKFVSCVANNNLGNANVTLSLNVNGNMQYMFIGIGAGVILVLLLIAVGVAKKWGRPADTTACTMNTMKAEKAVDLPQYATTKRLPPSFEKDSYDDVSCGGIYANDHVYGNMEADGDDAVYANM
ncbi:sialoadhesin-like isoform X2 [Acanthochromis polyacanthus]|uniref:sialoadhesin-like isoform X2 n=1 Tax=Acanthochromis polyacanthus TaxID=80966 RepID=UPI0022341E4B|nr:sialoadhesin-like isoform X2 [Acanthochromis polyacanthus]